MDSPPRLPASLPGLARQFGVLTHYTDAFGMRRGASADALLAVLRARGARIESLRDAREAARARAEEDFRRAVPSMLVAWDGRLDEVPLRVEATRDGGGAWMGWVGEGDAATRGRGAGSGAWRVNLEEVPRRGSRRRDGRRWTELRLPFRDRLPPGIHELRLEIAGTVHESRILAAPRRVHRSAERESPRSLGFFLPLHALRTGDDWGIGSFTDLRALIRWCRDREGEALGTLPLFATFLDEPFDPSPYAPVSRRMWNEIHLDLGDLPELAACPQARARLRDPALRRIVSDLGRGGLTDPRAAQAAKRSVLEPLVRWLDGPEASCPPPLPPRSSALRSPAPGRRDASLGAYLARHPEVRRYARFRAAIRRRGPAWSRWPAAEREGELPVRFESDPEARFHLYAQWFAHRQIESAAEEARRCGVDLVLDLPLGVHPDGFDVWDGRGLHATRIGVGAPPDAFFPRGQNWGFPPVNPEVSRARGHREWADVLRHAMGIARILRLDHVMGLHRQFWIPHGCDPAEGVYVRYPAEELLAVLSLESHRHGVAIVGEDLGTVPPEVRRSMRRHGIHRSFVLELELRADADRPLPRVPRDAFASLGTHDTPTFAGFATGEDIEDRVRLGLLAPEDAPAVREDRARRLAAWRGRLGLEGAGEEALLHGSLRRLARSKARWVVVNLEDLWLETEPQNVPGTTVERPNWRRRAREPLEAWAGLPGVRSALGACRRGPRRAGRPVKSGAGEAPAIAAAGRGEPEGRRRTREDRS